ncbi:MAG: phosphotransferase [Lachnospiraceae bacterium]|nr:phosphotransferase [Lachnospiraceae bacterium]
MKTDRMNEQINEIQKITIEYLHAPVKEIKAIGTGHINKSFLVVADKKYVLQRMNGRMFYEHLSDLENNYETYRKACLYAKEEQNSTGINSEEKGEWNCPEWVKCEAGSYFIRDDKGNIWRMYQYLESDVPKKNVEPFEAGKGIGKLHRILDKIPRGKIKAVIPHLHDLSYYYSGYQKIKDPKAMRDKGIEAYISKNIERMLDIHLMDDSVIHADVKPDNMIFSNGRVAGFIDLDTMMRGSIFNDIADGMRYCCENKEKKYMPDRAAEFIKGIEESRKKTFTGNEKELINMAYLRNRFMLGLRYYCDYLEGNVYFENTTAQDCLNKAQALLI